MSEEGSVSAGRPHPLGVKPSGNAFVFAISQRSKSVRRLHSEDASARVDCDVDDGNERILTLTHALGSKLAVIGEDLVLRVIGMLDARSLAALGCASQASFVYASFDELWRELALSQLPEVGSSEKKGAMPQEQWRFLGSWKASVLAMLTDGKDDGNRDDQSAPHAPGDVMATYLLPSTSSCSSSWSSSTQFVPRGTVCSDTLFRPWQYATAEISPKWTTRQVVETRNAASLSIDQFVEEFERPGIPLLIKGAIGCDVWPVANLWGREVSPTRPWRPAMCMLDMDMNAGGGGVDLKLAQCSFRVGPVDMRLCDFLSYAEQKEEETPLYLFDCKFVEKLLGGDVVFNKEDNVSNKVDMSSAPLYKVPKYFQNTAEHPHRDLFEYLGRRQRPDFRWLTIGSAKSGSRWHIDPNATHAWNGVVSGAKRWILFPPGNPPPGVQPSDDGADVTQPISLLEWFANFYDLQQAPIEFTSRAGDLVFVPRGWWHCVLNIEPCVAITQNYVSDTNLAQSLAFLQNKPELVAGCKSKDTLHDKFRQALATNAPALLDKIDKIERARLDKEEKRRKRRIDASTDPAFTFSFF